VPSVDRLELGPIGTNCYLVRADPSAREAVVIDPSGPAAAIQERLATSGARCVAILVTHGHWDHLLGVAELAEATGAPVHMAADERFLLEEPAAFAPPGITVRPWTPEILLAGDETLELAGMQLAVTRAPGHSPAHVAYHVDADLFSGDVLFAGSVGRTDIPGADWATLLASIADLLERYPADTVVWPGHGTETTLGHERATNPFLEPLRGSAVPGGER
jgi:glyoxylase-like metal-dependent hydrolase (beta-lactamase superfamily II)